MFCLMDTSASMTEHMKDLAKRFFALLYIFLKRRYRHVDIVFIRHTHQAEEVDEDTFFHSPETGGTVVSSALEEMTRVAARAIRARTGTSTRRRRPTATTARATAQPTAALLRDGVLPALPVFRLSRGRRRERAASPGFVARQTELWRTYRRVSRRSAASRCAR